MNKPKTTEIAMSVFPKIAQGAGMNGDSQERRSFKFFVLRALRKAPLAFLVSLPFAFMLLPYLPFLTSFLDQTRNKWIEEVRLETGEVITVKRTYHAGRTGLGPWDVKETTLRISSTVKTVPIPPVWQSKYMPLLFDYDSKANQWVVVATFLKCEGWYELGRPNLPYVEYRLADGEWMQSPLSPQLVGREANLLTDMKPHQVTSHTLESKRVVQSTSLIPEKYKKVVGQWSTTC